MTQAKKKSDCKTCGGAVETVRKEIKLLRAGDEDFQKPSPADGAAKGIVFHLERAVGL